MTVHTTVFPDKAEVTLVSNPNYGWAVVIDLGEGSRVYLTDELADQISADLWNRRLPKEIAA